MDFKFVVGQKVSYRPMGQRPALFTVIKQMPEEPRSSTSSGIGSKTMSKGLSASSMKSIFICRRKTIQTKPSGSSAASCRAIPPLPWASEQPAQTLLSGYRPYITRRHLALSFSRFACRHARQASGPSFGSTDLQSRRTSGRHAIKLADWNEALEPGSMSASFPKISGKARATKP